MTATEDSAVVGVRRCLNCDVELVATNKRGPRSSWCSAPCRNRTLYLRRLERGRGCDPCTLCGKLMQPTPTAAQIRVCLACRQRRKGERAAAKAAHAAADAGPWLKVCVLKGCGKTYLAEKKTRQFCSTDCFLACGRAQERIRDAERRKRRREEVPVLALLYRGDEEAGGLIAGPPATPTQVFLRTDPWGDHGTYTTRCPLCGWLTDAFPDVETDPVWGCDNCYTKIVLLAAPSQDPDPYRRIHLDVSG